MMSGNDQHSIESVKKSLTILGSTGSIGIQALDVARKLGCSVKVLAAHSNIKILEQQIREFRPDFAVLYDEKAAADLRVRISDLPVKIESGIDGLCNAAAYNSDLVINSVVGMVGLQPTLAAMKAGNDVALANKETLVAGGEIVIKTARKNGVNLLPVDSEHSAIFQCIQGAPPNRALRRIILTASGGPFFGKQSDELESVTPSDALKHPNWSMGSKITIDSATMMNKGLELIEARWLFDVEPENIDIVIHRESVIHSLIEYNDNSMIAQLGVPDMHIPIQYAITWPLRVECDDKRLDLTEWGKLNFYKPDYNTFVCMNVCRCAINNGGLVPVSVNAANETAVKLFLDGKIGFMDIGRLVSKALDYNIPKFADGTVEQILETDFYVRQETFASAQKIKR